MSCFLTELCKSLLLIYLSEHVSLSTRFFSLSLSLKTLSSLFITPKNLKSPSPSSNPATSTTIRKQHEKITEMPSDCGENRRLTKANNIQGPPPPEQEHLPCPRCDSTNTKFCYYNNYNFSQPRHFCKSCRRYWTQGGTLRDIPIGGGTRKNAKRSRTTTGVSATTNTAGAGTQSLALPGTSVLMPLGASNQGAAVQFGGGEVKGNGSLCGSFTSLLNTQGPGLLGMSGFGLGFEDIGFGLGRGVWPFPAVGDGGVAVGSHGAAAAAAAMSNTWHFESSDGGFANGDCFPWPDLAISTPGNSLK